jgi:uncharacterized OsmC-like protein
VTQPADLRSVQAPIKARYRENPEAARITLSASGYLDDVAIACNVETGRALARAGLHPASGGDGSLACSGDMLLQSLVACAGVTLKAVAASMGIVVRKGHVTAEADLDFRGTLGVSPDSRVGFSEIRLKFDLHTDAPADRVATLLRLTERYCVVYQTLRNSPRLSVAVDTKGDR